MEKAYKFRIYPNKNQECLLSKTFGCVRFVWNHFLAEKEQAYLDNIKGLGFATLCKELPSLKRDYPWLTEVDSTALQRTIKHLIKAYDRFFSIQKKSSGYTEKKRKWAERTGKTLTRFDLNGHPQFKKKRDNHRSYTTVFSNNNIGITGTHIKLPKIGFVRYRDKRNSIEGRILSATVSQEPSGKYYVSICCTEIPESTTITCKTGKAVGIDLGIKEFGITSDGQKFENPKYLRTRLKALRRLSRALSRKTKDGSRWNKNRKRLAILYERIRHSRLDYQQKLSTQLVKDYDIICIESLAVKNMVKNRRLSRAIAEVAWSQFVTLLQYKSDWNNKQLIKIDTFFASSQTCSVCGYKNPEVKDLAVREWTCPECGTHHDRDINAAKNILIKGLK